MTSDPFPYVPSSSSVAVESRFELALKNLRGLEPPQVLGHGNYGEVCLAELYTKKSGKWIKVAKKTTRDPRASTGKELKTQQDSLKQEIHIMSLVGEHPYVLRLIGAITTQRMEDLCMVTEYCEFGSLDKFLKEKRESGQFVDEIIKNIGQQAAGSSRSTKYIAQMNPKWSSGFKIRRKREKITTSDLLAFSYQTTTGMIFLHEKKVLHRDLSLRNILLKLDFVVKISDFGLSRVTNEDGIYVLGNPDIQHPMPSAPENGTFNNGCPVSLKADWWTIGILLWEMFHLGAEIPFAEHTRPSMISFLNAGNILNCPEFAPHEIFELMKELWLLNPDDRVDLTESQRRLKVQLKKSCPQLADELIAIDKKIDQQQQQQQKQQQKLAPSPPKPLQQPQIQQQPSLLIVSPQTQLQLPQQQHPEPSHHLQRKLSESPLQRLQQPEPSAQQGQQPEPPLKQQQQPEPPPLQPQQPEPPLKQQQQPEPPLQQQQQSEPPLQQQHQPEPPTLQSQQPEPPPLQPQQPEPPLQQQQQSEPPTLQSQQPEPPPLQPQQPEPSLQQQHQPEPPHRPLHQLAEHHGEQHQLEDEQIEHNESSLQQQVEHQTIADTEEAEQLLFIKEPLLSVVSSSTTRTLDYELMQIENCCLKLNQRASNFGCIKKLRNVTQRRNCCCFCVIAFSLVSVLLIWLFWRFVLSKDDTKIEVVAPILLHTSTEMNATDPKTMKIMSDCGDWLHFNRSSSNGLYKINPTGLQSFEVYCDMESNGGGWTVIQRRMEASDFDFVSKTWIEYKDGFSDEMHENLWLGNEKIHKLTTKTSENIFVELRVDVWTDSSGYFFGEYDNFQISNESKNYTMTISKVIRGNATSLNETGTGSIMFSSGLPFSTIDRNAIDGYCKTAENVCADSCLQSKEGVCEDYCSGDQKMGGWWMHEETCGYVSLNGGINTGFVWNIGKKTTNKHFLRRSEMKLRKI